MSAPFAEYLKLDNLELTVVTEKTLRKKSDVTSSMLPQLAYVINACYFGDAKTVADCFEERVVDNGLVSFQEISSKLVAGLRLYYWWGCFGGNQTAYVLLGTDPSSDCGDSDAGGWEVVVENCDGDFTYRGEAQLDDITRQKFLKSVKKVAMGRHYESEEDE